MVTAYGLVTPLTVGGLSAPMVTVWIGPRDTHSRIPVLHRLRVRQDCCDWLKPLPRTL